MVWFADSQYKPAVVVRCVPLSLTLHYLEYQSQRPPAGLVYAHSWDMWYRIRSSGSLSYTCHGSNGIQTGRPATL